MKPMEFNGRWVLVTGASSGIGREMAVQLARDHGAHIVAVARRGHRLEALQRDLQAMGSKVETIVADLGNMDEVDRVIRQATEGRELYAAVLNAGVTHFGPYEELPWADFEAMLNINVRAAVRMTTELIPKVERSHGGVMLVSSLSGLTPVPYQTAYSATKAFLISFGSCLWHELRGRNVSLTTYAPGGVATEMTAGKRFKPLQGWLMDVDQVARDGIDAFRRRRDLFIPGVTYRVGTALLGILPRRLVVGSIAAAYRRALVKTTPNP